MALSSSCFLFSALLLGYCFLFVATQAQVPAQQTFKFINRGEFGQPTAEYNANYRVIQTKNINFFTYPFQLCFYRTIPGAYILAIRAGIPGDQTPMRWVWDANRNHPVGENSVLSFASNGNLVLAEANGRIVWQTNTANRGVTGIKLLPNGNLVLHNAKGRPIWQSFDYPTDTLLVGQSLRTNGINKLISRKSDTDGSDGPYSLVHQENEGLYLYVKDNYGQLIRYSGWGYAERAATVVFDGKAAENHNSTAHVLAFTAYRNQTTLPPPSDIFTLRTLNYNTTLSFVRIGSDGNLKAYTYQVGSNGRSSKWEEGFAYFSTYWASLCSLPTRCGSFGLCERGVCLACPTPKGLVSWNQSCAPPKLSPCQNGAAKKVNYYNVTGAQHFTDNVANGGEGMSFEECKSKCDADCKCLGFFMFEDFRCIIATVLGTLRKAEKTTAYIKY
ncbi:hypothetical protein FEM48_Zijuj12G0113500 [Ziziphus jujuba var. spinosa]|uniref:Bulb-type lectin domain-containing protein n=1 Tax=Ziziphus jujuba var. spinosa TaxID=714518 RepID=A0A978UD08_ZIZJJ|nr:hypothetical protein FEM48_Zijuj12G0113500 [Ziziphus jujuba var. spinosa]